MTYNSRREGLRAVNEIGVLCSISTCDTLFGRASRALLNKLLLTSVNDIHKKLKIIFAARSN